MYIAEDSATLWPCCCISYNNEQVTLGLLYEKNGLWFENMSPNAFVTVTRMWKCDAVMDGESGTEKMIEIGMNRWNWSTKWGRKLILGILKTAISDFQRRSGVWTSKCDNRREMSISSSLKGDETAQINWLTRGENPIVSKREINLYCSSTFSQWRDSRTGVMRDYLVALARERGGEFWMCWSLIIWVLSLR